MKSFILLLLLLSFYASSATISATNSQEIESLLVKALSSKTAVLKEMQAQEFVYGEKAKVNRISGTIQTVKNPKANKYNIRSIDQLHNCKMNLNIEYSFINAGEEKELPIEVLSFGRCPKN